MEEKQNKNAERSKRGTFLEIRLTVEGEEGWRVDFSNEKPTVTGTMTHREMGLVKWLNDRLRELKCK